MHSFDLKTVILSHSKPGIQSQNFFCNMYYILYSNLQTSFMKVVAFGNLRNKTEEKETICIHLITKTAFHHNITRHPVKTFFYMQVVRFHVLMDKLE